MKVTIDTKDDAQVQRFKDALDVRVFLAARTGHTIEDSIIAALLKYAEPKMLEPGDWGVVEASCVHGEGRMKWVRNPDGNWYPFEVVPGPLRNPDDWDSLRDPILIRRGLT